MVSSAIEPLLWTPCWYFCRRALFNDPLAATLVAHLLPLDLDALWLDVELVCCRVLASYPRTHRVVPQVENCYLHVREKEEGQSAPAAGRGVRAGSQISRRAIDICPPVGGGDVLHNTILMRDVTPSRLLFTIDRSTVQPQPECQRRIWIRQRGPADGLLATTLDDHGGGKSDE
jgi:hypothetical protein